MKKTERIFLTSLLLAIATALLVLPMMEGDSKQNPHHNHPTAAQLEESKDSARITGSHTSTLKEKEAAQQPSTPSIQITFVTYRTNTL